MRYVAVVNASTGKTRASRAAAGSGLILLPSKGIHVFLMYLRIDGVFVCEAGEVLRVARGLQPWTVGPVVPGARYCPEFPEAAPPRHSPAT